MKIQDIQWLTILCNESEYAKCELTNLMADCYRCLITDQDGFEYEADINRHDVANIINCETSCCTYK